MKKIFLLILCLAPVVTVAGVNERSLANKLVTAYLDRFGSVEEILNNSPIDIDDKTHVCSLCHGKKGNSTIVNIPSLAGQNPLYFVEQILVFQNAGRYPKMMHEMVKKLDEESMITIAFYYSKLPRTLADKVDSTMDAKGKKLFTALCSHCHGERATGANDSYANIRKQRPDYLITTIKRFRESDRKRTSHVMGSVAKDMSDEEIAALANYIAGL